MERGYWIRSKPIYSSLVWHEKATAHFVVAEGEGGIAVLKLFQQMYPEQPVRVFYASAQHANKDYTEILSRLVPEGLEVFPSIDAALKCLQGALPGCRMGTRFYVAGSEAFIWSVAQAVKPFGVLDNDIQKELSGTLARSVYCVHCQTTTHDVHHNIAECSGCQRKLFVRDHFSRRLGAYMGFMIDAEVPGNVPTIEEVYP